MAHFLEHPDAEISITDAVDGKATVSVSMKSEDAFIPIPACETTYPVELIETILGIIGPAYLCDEIMRDQSPDYIEKHLVYDVFGYLDKERFKGKRALDFGCGSGASTMVLSRMLPETSFAGVELESRLLKLAEARTKHYQLEDRVAFYLSPDGTSLPEDIGEFDFIFLNAVYEHLLPKERAIIFPLLWRHLKPNGVLFINETPYRWFPIETHTTSGSIFLNYMPDGLACFCARHFSKRNLKDMTWPKLLRAGIRGGSVGEIHRILKKQPVQPTLLTPTQLGLKDRIDLWYVVAKKSRFLVLKKCFCGLVKLIKATTGQIVLPTLSLAIQKSGDETCFAGASKDKG